MASSNRKGKSNSRNYDKQRRGKSNSRDRSGKKTDYKKPTNRDEDYTANKSYAAENGANDISWYSKYPDLLIAASQVPYPYRPGMQLPLSSTVSGYPTIGIPGVISLEWMPTIGYSEENTDPASVVAKQIYSQVRKVYSGSLEADAPDFVIYLAALDSIYAYIAWLKRIYRTLTAYSPNNYATPDMLLQAYGLTLDQAEELRRDKVRFWEMINTLVYMTRKFTCPAVMDIFNRHYWLSDNVYTDANSMNSQFFVFNLVAVYQLTTANTPQGVQAEALMYSKIFYNLSPYAGTIADKLFGYGQNLIQKLVDWDVSYTISGYLARAYEGTPSFEIALLAADETLTPIYNEEVLSQIENSRGLPFYNGLNYFSGGVTTFIAVTQDPLTNTVLSPQQFMTNVAKANLNQYNDAGRMDALVSIRSDTPTAADTVIATRLLNTAEYIVAQETDKNLTIQIKSGTEIMLGYKLFSPGVASTYVPSVYVIDEITGSLPSALMTLQHAFQMAQFDWAPGVLVIVNSNGATNYAFFSRDLHNVTSIPKQQLDRINTVCLYSEFNAFNF